MNFRQGEKWKGKIFEGTRGSKQQPAVILEDMAAAAGHT